jgi:hypothetical protein
MRAQPRPPKGELMQPTTDRPNPDSAQDTEIVETAGEIFDDGTALELVVPGDVPRLKLLWWDGARATIQDNLVRHEKIYQVVDVVASIWNAIRFASNAADYGSVAELFARVRTILAHYLGLPDADAALLGAWLATTWFADVLFGPPTLMVFGTDMIYAIQLFRLLRLFSYRGLMLSEITRSALTSPLMLLHPTLFLNTPGMPSGLRDLCVNSNYRGIFMPGSGGTLHNIVSSRAVFVGNENWGRAWGGAILPLVLPPAPRCLPPLDEDTEAQIAADLLPKFLMYRLRNVTKVRESQFSASDLAGPMWTIARALRACSQDNGQGWLGLLQSQEEDALAKRCFDPCCAMVEILWELLHQGLRELGVTDLTRLTNTRLGSRGERRQYSAEECGKKLEIMGLIRYRKNFGMVIRLDRVTSRRVHGLADDFGISAKVAGCPDCVEQAGAE